jgi:hypothetical protein
MSDENQISETQPAPAARKTRQKTISPLWVAAGLPLILLAAYLMTWLTDIMEQMKACESASRHIFEASSCGKASFVPELLMTVAYGWSGLVMMFAILSRKATPAIVMALILVLLGLVHFCTAYLGGLAI